MEDEGPIQSLPDELLIKIFGHIVEAKTLLDGVPLVCKRWNALAREAQAWASVEHCDATVTARALRLRLLQRAPALRALKLGLHEPAELATLRRSQLVVTDTLFIFSGGLSEDASEVHRLLWRSRHHLRLLFLNIWSYDPCFLCADHGGGRSLFNVLMAMPKLRWLDVRVFAAKPVVPAACAPGPVLPTLQLRELSLELYDLPSFPACALTLLRAAAPSLRSLQLLEKSKLLRPISAELEAALGLIVGLRHVAFEVQLPPLSALAAWTTLESLQVLDVHIDSEERRRQLDHFLQCCARIGSLRKLRGQYLFVEAMDGLERCKELVAAFRQARPAVDVLLKAYMKGGLEYDL